MKKALNFFALILSLFLIGCTNKNATIDFNEKEINLKTNEEYTFNINQEVTYLIEDEAIVSINGNVLIGLKEGGTKVTISLKSDSKIYKEVIVYVSNTVYTIDYDLNGGVCNNLVLSFNTLPVELLVPEKEGYNFIGWYENDRLIEEMEYKDYNLVAKWEIKNFTVSFYDDEGNLYESKIYNYGEKIVEYNNPVKEESDLYTYEFVGWDREFNICNCDLNIYAIFEEIEKVKSYQVNFYCDELLIDSQMIVYGNRINDVNLNKLNTNKMVFKIVGYYTDNTCQNVFSIRTRIVEDCDIFLKLSYLPVLSSYKDSTISILGDSISTFYQSGSKINSYYSGTNEYYYPLYSSTVKDYSLTWWWKTISSLEAKIGINNSWSGSSCYNNGSETNSGAMNYGRINTLGENGEPDIIIINIGTNDNVNGTSLAIFEKAYRTMLSRISTKYPNAYIVCMNLGYSAYTGYNYTEERRIGYNLIIEKVCKEYLGIVCDIASVQTINTYTSILGDRLHPNSDGMIIICTQVVNDIKSFWTYGEAYN